jgi:hypothetical protein
MTGILLNHFAIDSINNKMKGTGSIFPITAKNRE